MKIKHFSLIFILMILGCNKERPDSGMAPSHLIKGNYKGVLQVCVPNQCNEYDTTFSIVRKDGKTIVKIGNIEDTIVAVDKNRFSSTKITWDSTGRTGQYGVNGWYRNDSIEMVLGSFYFNYHTYKNIFKGVKK